MKILYLHGIGSGANSRTARELRKFFLDIEIIAPELPARPKDAVKFLSDHYALEDEIDLVIGTSLGGFYALTLPMVKKLLINPALYADEDIRKALGLGSQRFLCERSDGETEYIIDEEFVSELTEIKRKIYEKDILRPDRIDHNLVNETYALFGRKDGVVGHYDDFCEVFSKENAYTFSGEHRLTIEEIETVLVPLVKKVLAEPPIPYVYVFSEMEE